jgi:hypothetical protein
VAFLCPSSARSARTTKRDRNGLWKTKKPARPFGRAGFDVAGLAAQPGTGTTPSSEDGDNEGDLGAELVLFTIGMPDLIPSERDTLLRDRFAQSKTYKSVDVTMERSTILDSKPIGNRV